MFMYSDGGMISRGAYPPWLQGKRKKLRWRNSFKYPHVQVKGDKYKPCPTCRGVGGNRECTICCGGGMTSIQRQKTNGGSNTYGIRQQSTDGSSQGNMSNDNLVYEDLPFVRDTDGECCNCRKFPNRESVMEMSNGQDKVVVQCSNCQTVMRSHRRR